MMVVWGGFSTGVAALVFATLLTNGAEKKRLGGFA